MAARGFKTGGGPRPRSLRRVGGDPPDGRPPPVPSRAKTRRQRGQSRRGHPPLTAARASTRGRSIGTADALAWDKTEQRGARCGRPTCTYAMAPAAPRTSAGSVTYECPNAGPVGNQQTARSLVLYPCSGGRSLDDARADVRVDAKVNGWAASDPAAAQQQVHECATAGKRMGRRIIMIEFVALYV